MQLLDLKNNYDQLFQKYLHGTQATEVGPRDQTVHHHSAGHKAVQERITASPPLSTPASASRSQVSGSSGFC